jgi:hypothetical protein
MSTPQNGDFLIVGDTSAGGWQRKWDCNRMIQAGTSNDLVAVERSGTVYKCTWADFRWKSSSDFVTSANRNLDIYSSNQMVTLPTWYRSGTSYDSNDAYYICEARVNVNGTTGYQVDNRSGNLYVGVRNSANTNYYGDFVLGNIQILSGSGERFSGYGGGAAGDWSFGNSSRLGYGNWSTNTSSNSSTSTDPSGLSYSAIAWGTTGNRWNANNYTPSSYAGANNGIYGCSYGQNTYMGGGTKVLPPQGSTVSQVSNTSYIYTEGSGQTVGSIVWMKNNYWSRIYNGDIIRFTYLGRSGTSNSNGLQWTNTFYLRFK